MEFLEAWKAARNAIVHALLAKTNERILIICDEEKKPIAEAFAKGAINLDLWTRVIILKKPKTPRKNIPKQLQEVLKQKSDIYINLLGGSREETPFRIKLIKTEIQNQKSRLGHCPGLTLDMLIKGSLSLSKNEHKIMHSQAENLISNLQGTTKITVTNPTGTNLTFSTKNRIFFSDTKIDQKIMNWLNLPTGEVMVAPVENSLNGKLVCDMAVGGIGKLKNPIELSVKNGKVNNLSSSDSVQFKRVNETLQTDEWANVVGEFALGINSKARFVDEFLEAEKILGTAHIAFGANTDMPGGKNPSKNHLDMLFSKPTVKVTKQNGEIVTVLKNGHFKI